jgi:AcrR family transcriptional regulator
MSSVATEKHPRRRRAPDTFDKIFLAARQEFAAKGFMGAEVEAIARDAGVSKQVVYYYYKSKSDLYEAVVKSTAEQCLARILQLDFDSLDPIDAALLLFGTFFDFHVEMPFLAPMGLDLNFHGYAHIKSTAMYRQVFSVYDGIIARAIAKNLVSPDIDAATCFTFGIFLVIASFLRRDRVWGYRDTSVDSPERIRRQRNEVLKAIRAILTDHA